MSLIDKLKSLKPEDARELLVEIVAFFSTPSFGSPSKDDLRVHLFDRLRRRNVIEENADAYMVGRLLNIRETEARTLIAKADARRDDLGQDRRDAMLIDALLGLRFEPSGKHILIEIERDALRDHLRSHARKAGHLADGAFNQSIVKLSFAATAAVIDRLTPQEGQEALRRKLGEYAPNKLTYRDVVKGVLGALLKKVMGEAGDAAADQAVAMVAPYINMLFNRSDVAQIDDAKAQELLREYGEDLSADPETDEV